MGRGRPMKHCDTACRSAAYRRRRRANATSPAPATSSWPGDVVLPGITGPPSEQLPLIADEFAFDVHLYLGALKDADTRPVDELLASLEEDWPAFLERLLEQARLARTEHAQDADGAAASPPTATRSAAADKAPQGRSPAAQREQWTSFLDRPPAAPPPLPPDPADRYGPTDTELPLTGAGTFNRLRTWSGFGERPPVYLVHSHGPYPYGWVEYGLTGPHWSAILTGPAAGAST